MNPRFQVYIIVSILFLSSLGLIFSFEDSNLHTQGATILYVGPAATYQNIQVAIDNANPGDEVYVYKGTYQENLTITKNISLRGEEKESTIINNSGSGSTIRISANDVNISGFTITGSGLEWGNAGILMDTVQNCNVFNNIVSNNYMGIRIQLSKEIMINNNTVHNNVGPGISIEDSQANTVENNVISPNNQVGVSIINSKSNQISKNTISNNYRVGIDTVDSNENDIIDNVISENQGNALEFWSSNNNNINNNKIELNLEDGIHLQASQYNSFKNNQLTKNGFSLAGFSVNDWDTHTIDDTNTINGKPVYYKTNELSGSISSGAGQVIITNCSNIFIESQTIKDTSEGIILGFSSHCTIRNNDVSSNRKYGISLWRSNNNIIDRNSVNSNKEIGISCIDSRGNTIEKNTVSNNKFGIVIRSSTNSKINNNTLTNNGLYITGNLIDFYRAEYPDKILDDKGKVIWSYSRAYWTTHTVDKSNTVNGKPIYYWKNRNKGTVPSDAGQVILANCSNVIIEGQDLSDTSVGIELGFSTGNTIKNNIVSSNVWQGIYLESSDFNTLINNSLSKNNKNGILLDYSQENSITNNNASSNSENGIMLYYSANNTITNNTVSKNNGGISLELSVDNELVNNYLLKNKDYGVFIDSESQNNLVHHNDFIDNPTQATDFGINQWYLEYPGGGNYWSDYEGRDNFSGPSQNLSGKDGFGDIPYEEIDSWEDAIDLYPLYRAPPSKFEKPTAPLNLQAKGKDGYVILTWQPPEDDGGTSITNYRIYRRNGTSPDILLATIDNLTIYNDADVTNEQEYQYFVSAVNIEGEGPSSLNVTAVPTAKQEPDNGDQDDDSILYLYLSLILIIIWVLIIVIIFLGMRKRPKSGSKQEPTKDTKSADETKVEDEKK